MTALGELLGEKPLSISCETSSETAAAYSEASERKRDFEHEATFAFSSRDEQIHALVEQLFFRHRSGPVRSVGFTPVEAATSTARLCFEAAKVLAEEGKYDVGVIDAGFGQIPLADELRIPSPANGGTPWAAAQRLWLIPRESWCQDRGRQPASNQNLERLREYIAEFDFSIVHCRPVSWLTARVGQNCDGLVVVLTANKTRRAVATQIKDQLSRAHVPLLGTVLAERRFPVPTGLYRSL
jgi:hypothetical protein